MSASATGAWVGKLGATGVVPLLALEAGASTGGAGTASGAGGAGAAAGGGAAVVAGGGAENGALIASLRFVRKTEIINQISEI